MSCTTAPIDALIAKPIQMACDIYCQDLPRLCSLVSIAISILLQNDTSSLEKGLYFCLSGRFYQVRFNENKGHQIVVTQIEAEQCRNTGNDVIQPIVSGTIARYIKENKILGMMGRMIIANQDHYN